MNQPSKRIAFLISSLGLGGAERNTVRLASRFQSEGWQVLVLTLRGDERDFFSLSPDIERRSISRHGKSGEGSGALANVRRLRAIRREVQEFGAETLVCMMTTSGVLGILAMTGLPVRVIVSERNFPARTDLDGPWRLLRKLTYRRAYHFVGQTVEGTEWVRAHLGVRCASVIPNAVSYPLLCEASKPCLEPETDERKIILAVGTKPYQKGFDLLLRAVAPLLQREPNWALVVLGIDQATLLSHMPEIHDSDQREDPPMDRIRALGAVGNPGAWYEAAQLFVLSSRYEGFPNSLVEAMASGCACVAFACPTGPAEILEDNRNGLLVPNGDVAALGSAIHELMINDDKRQRLGATARDVLMRYGDATVFDRWVKVVSPRTVEEQRAPC